MKKIFSILVFTVVLCPFGFAQSTPLPGIEVIIKAIENRITDPDFVEPAFFTERVIDGEYQTVEENRLRMTPEEYREFYAKEPILNAPETKTTNQYKKAIIRIPAGYTVYDVSIGMNKETGKPYLFLANDLISIEESDIGDISFKLDYKIYPLKPYQRELLEKGYDYDINSRVLKLEVNYDPKYFTLKKVTNYEPNKKVSILYQGKIVILNTFTRSLLYVQDKDGNDIEFVLEPNFQNLYKDFKFVREGHKEVQFRDIE